MCARPDQPDPRDQAMERLLKQALQPASPSPAADAAAACPDPELLAAYADQGLGPGKGPLENDERAQLENHFSSCERCRQVLAVLGVALEAPAGASVAVMPAPAAAPAPPQPAARPAPSPQRWLWWLSPAFGAAAAALLWMALRPAAPAPVQTAADYSRPAEQQPDSLTAQANLPPSPADAGAPRAKVAESAGFGARADTGQTEARNEQASREASSGGGLGGGTRTGSGGALPRDEVDRFAAPPAGTFGAAPPLPAAPPAPPGENQVAAAPQADAAAQAAAAPRQQTQAVTITEEVPLVNTSSATLGGSLAGRTIADLPITARSSGQLVLYTYSFTSPEGDAQWRLGAAGLIEKSTDNGRTWQQQASGVTVDLLAGSAATNEVAWIVGRAGVILRTTDGRQWQRIAPPAGITDDWVTVVVRSATSATVVGSIRRFATEDGGMTWTEQQ